MFLAPTPRPTPPTQPNPTQPNPTQPNSTQPKPTHPPTPSHPQTQLHASSRQEQLRQEFEAYGHVEEIFIKASFETRAASTSPAEKENGVMTRGLRDPLTLFQPWPLVVWCILRFEFVPLAFGGLMQNWLSFFRGLWFPYLDHKQSWYQLIPSSQIGPSQPVSDCLVPALGPRCFIFLGPWPPLLQPCRASSGCPNKNRVDGCEIQTSHHLRSHG